MSALSANAGRFSIRAFEGCKHMLHEFLTSNTPEIIARTRAKLATRTSPLPTDDELKNGVPLFLAQLIAQLQLATLDNNNKAIGVSAGHHGGELLAMGFTISQVVHGYGDVCQAITQLADEMNAPITVDEFQIFNRCQDDATAQAVTEFERLRDLSVADKGTQRQGILAHEMGNRVTAALVAFNILQKGVVGIRGSTGAVLGRSLEALRTLIDNSLSEVRLESGSVVMERISGSQAVARARFEASLGGAADGLDFYVPAVEPGLELQADPQILSSALSNLLQNAFKFTRSKGRVSLRVRPKGDRVLFEVQDQCGGLAQGDPEGLFQPFAQRNSNRTGVGLGLTIARKGVEAMAGRLTVRDLPGEGCVFTIDLPQLRAN